MSKRTSKTYCMLLMLGFSFSQSEAQKLLPFKLPETGQTAGYTSTAGEDCDYLINPQSFTDKGDGTITDNNTLLMWQKTDGGEMTVENAEIYCNNLALAGYSDWRLPSAVELFSINSYNHLNPALNTEFFTLTQAEYWWTSEKQADDQMKVWVVNAGGGIGAHPKSETIGAGGTRRFHGRAVRNIVTTAFALPHFSDNGNGTISDNFTGLAWQKYQPADLMTWEEALAYSHTVDLGGKTDWRLPNVKEIQSAWDINVDYGIVSYSDKTNKENVLLVRGGMDKEFLNFTEVSIPGGDYEMGDHNGHYDPSHPSDEIPVHQVKVDSFNMSKTEITNEQFLAFLNASLLAGAVSVNNNKVHLTGDTTTLYYTYQYAPYYSIGYDGSMFSIADFRIHHPVVGVMWNGAAAFCNWLSGQNGLDACFDLAAGTCDFTKHGYRLATEAEWEYAGRGGHLNPYLKYPNGNTVVVNKANLPNSGDPYEISSYPLTTPAGFYDGTLKQKSDYNWPGSAATYQTSDGANGYGLYDMQGNVWELIWDWYGNNYYSLSPYDNPKGPDAGSIMPDGKPYRSMRGGNWYNGIDSNNVNDGHSRVSNRDPSYFRGPQDPNHPWYHVGFRAVRSYSEVLGWNEQGITKPESCKLVQNYPNPFSGSTSVKFYVSRISHVILKVSNKLGLEVARLVEEEKGPGWYTVEWNSAASVSGIYFCCLAADNDKSTIKMIIIK
ncbi:MAG: SUMF1/EgtB/PvdO family nonheme iron enzyme [Bacteroidetes bacterium]|nr:SUMF1/EgtB/PvdO family nonheme iron enzyme [Bacteroidota bacterium]